MSCLAEIKRLIRLEIRKNPDLNQKIVAEKMGISSGYLSDLFRKEDMGGFQRIEQMCEAIGLNFADTVRRASAGAEVINMPFMDVRDFKDPDYFQTLRNKLLAFEQEAPDAYYTLLRHIEVDLTWARAKKSRKRRKGN